MHGVTEWSNEVDRHASCTFGQSRTCVYNEFLNFGTYVGMYGKMQLPFHDPAKRVCIIIVKPKRLRFRRNCRILQIVSRRQNFNVDRDLKKHAAEADRGQVVSSTVDHVRVQGHG